MRAHPVVAFLLGLGVVITAAATVPGCTTRHPSDDFDAGQPGPSTSLPVSVTCDVGDLVHVTFPTMTDVQVVARYNGATRKALARMGSYTWDGAETVVGPEPPRRGVLEVLEPRGPVLLSCVRYSSVQVPTSAVLRPEAGTATTAADDDSGAFKAGPPGGGGRG